MDLSVLLIAAIAFALGVLLGFTLWSDRDQSEDVEHAIATILKDAALQMEHGRRGRSVEVDIETLVPLAECRDTLAARTFLDYWTVDR